MTGNPFVFKEALSKLDIALNDVIAALEHEEGSMGSSGNESALLQKFKSWRLEIVGVERKTGPDRNAGTTQEGGLFTD